ncbi:homogentisate 1,2-dioxygenase [Catenovulum sp. SM1970]|uniref:homogentisate 1,2-dioxygenase n=1 Tax=Marinifaba aquimaris TaxID=2741323 RepID=UPI001573AFF8|nr:homogentisate 1,2-dioxygenase [Marinifaba aquimaris]NTS78802.1 homogentisate 1,2-dioxygenase [Marinifaba aquimaris]
MKHWITTPHKEGLVSNQAHADLPNAAIYEREVGREGFFGPATHIHHKHAPTGWVDWQGPLKPRLFNLVELDADHESPWVAKHLLSNPHCKFRIWQCLTSMKQLVRNADGDDLLFIHQGNGVLFCDYGRLEINEGDYVLLPRSTMWRIEVIKPITMLMIEATNGAYQLPEKGLVGKHAIFDPAMLQRPAIDQAFLEQQDENHWQVKVKRHEQVSTITYPFNPLDAQGWHGDLSVVKINWRDIRPLMSHRYHLPPSAHTTFVAPRFVVCTFVPRPIESDSGALKVPFYHSNDDYDEVLFYHAGDFFSRDNIEAGMLSFHPAGFSHGPHPKAFKAGLEYKKKHTDEVAVMIDTRDALHFSDTLSQVEDAEYVNSWQVK